MDAAPTSWLRKIQKSGVPLGEYVGGCVYRGITTGYNDAFIISASKRAELLAEDPKCEELIKPYAMGREIRMWSLPENRFYIIFTQRGVNIEAFPFIKTHLAQWKNELQPKSNATQKIGRKPGRYKWYEVQDEIAYADEFDKPKIVTTKAALRPAFALDISGRYLGNTSYFLPLSSMTNVNYVMGVLNSNLIWQYLKLVTVTLGDPGQRGRLEPRRDDIMNIPIPRADAADQAIISALVQKCLDAEGVGCEVWEQEINEWVAALYGL